MPSPDEKGQSLTEEQSLFLESLPSVVDVRRRTYSPEVSADIAAKLAAKDAEIAALTAERDAETERRQALEQRVAELFEMVEKRNVALRETREALVSIAFDACGYICPSTWKVGMPVLHSTRCLTVQAVLARHAGLVEGVGRG